MSDATRCIAFIDRDGTLIVEPPDEQVDSLEKLELMPGVVTGLRSLADAGYELVMVTNQDGLGSASYPQESFDLVQSKLLGLLAGEGIAFDEVRICPHRDSDGCDCRKPATGLVDDILARAGVDLARSVVIGDRPSDVALARAIGCRAVLIEKGAGSSRQSDAGRAEHNNGIGSRAELIDNADRRAVPGNDARDGSGVDIEADHRAYSFGNACRWIVRVNRSASVERVTSETAVRVALCLDGTGEHRVDTGIGFFDHMLAQVARHALIDLDIEVAGDLHVDEHHTVEDTGLALGSALAAALGDKRGIGRYGFVLPMDDARAEVALDLGGRPYLAFDARLRREKVGGLPTELVEEFFRALATSLGANVHMTARGRNEHHMIEAMFKGVGRALRQAVAVDPRVQGVLPTTKGAL